MSEIKIFSNPEFGEIRTSIQGGDVWFVSADVCKALEIGNPTMATDRLDEDERTLISIEGVGNGKPVNAVNESGLYSLVLGSRKKEAKQFKRWITHEVLPSIRKHGAYMTPETLEAAILNPDTMIRVLTALKDEQSKTASLAEEVAKRGQIIAELNPKATYYDLILQCTGSISPSKIAKDYGKSARWLNEKTA